MAKKPGWGEAKCPDCSAIIKVPVEQCPNCARTFGLSQQAAWRSQKRMGIGCTVLLGLGLILALGQCGKDSAAPAPVPSAPGPTAKADAIALFKAVTTAVGKCDARAERVNRLLAQADTVSAYMAAQDAEAECLAAPDAIKAIAVPSSLGAAQHQQAAEGVAACADAYVAKWAQLKSIREGLDKGAGVAVQADIKQSGEDAQRGVLLCSVRLIGVANAMGATMKDLGISG